MQKAVYNKNELRIFVRDMISGKVKTLEFYLNFTLEASREIKKTSKYDSIREEMQEEIYHLDKQMANLKNMQQQMKKVLNSASEHAKLGSLVITNKARFYISVSLGEFFFALCDFHSSTRLHGLTIAHSTLHCLSALVL